MTSIAVAICRFSDNQFKRLYLKKKRLFCQFFIQFLKCAWKLEHFKKKEEYDNPIITEMNASERDVYLSV